MYSMKHFELCFHGNTEYVYSHIDNVCYIIILMKVKKALKFKIKQIAQVKVAQINQN